MLKCHGIGLRLEIPDLSSSLCRLLLLPLLLRTPTVQSREPIGSSLCPHLEASPCPICFPLLWPLPWWSSWDPECRSPVLPPSGRHWESLATGSCPESCVRPGCASVDWKINKHACGRRISKKNPKQNTALWLYHSISRVKLKNEQKIKKKV